MNELTTTFRIESPPAWLEIGYDAENNWRTITVNCEYWFNIDSNGVVVLMFKPSCSKPAYPLKTERDGNNIVWTPESAELVAGVGTMQAFFEVDGTTIGASKKIPCEVDGSLLGSASGGTPPWAVEVIEEIKTLTGHYPYIADGKLYVWDSINEEWVEFASEGGGAVDSVNGKTGVVVLNADDVGALPAGTPIPAEVTEQTVAGWGFTKNTGTYSKPSGGIPKTDLASDVQTSLGKADTALQQHQSLSGYATETWVGQQIAAIPDELPSVSASDNGKVLGVVNGAWAAKADEGGGGGSVTVDSALSATSTNPVQNKVVKAALDAKADASALSSKQDTLTAGQNVTISGNTISANVDSAEIASNVTDWLEENVDPVGSAVVVDSSLTVRGAAADAKAVGDVLGAGEYTLGDPGNWERKYIVNGAQSSSETRIMTADYLPSSITQVTCASGYSSLIHRYTLSGEYAGFWRDGSFVTTGSGIYRQEFDIPQDSYRYVLVLKKNDNATITTDAAVNITSDADGQSTEGLIQRVAALEEAIDDVQVTTDTTLKIEGAPADAKATGDAIRNIQHSLGGTEDADFAEDVSNYYISSNTNKWGSDSNTSSAIVTIPANAKSVTVTANSTANAVIAILKSDNRELGQTAQYAEGCSRAVITAGTTVEFEIPSDGAFLYALLASGNSTYQPSSAVFKFQSLIVETDELSLAATRLGLHTSPESSGVLNMIKRARQMTDIKWTPAVDLPRFMLPSISPDRGGDYTIDKVSYYIGVFKAGVEYTGIPYGRCTQNIQNYGVSDSFVGCTIDFETFITAVRNPDSIICKESVGSVSAHKSTVYAAVCSALVSYAMGIAYKDTSQIVALSSVTSVGQLVNGTARLDPKSIKLGDLLYLADVHIAMITDIVTDDDGEVTAVEISEATVVGEANPDIEGGQVGGLCRRHGLSLEDLYAYWGAYTVYRYTLASSVTYTPSKFVNVGDELNYSRFEDLPCVPYTGEGFVYHAGSIPNTKILVNASGFSFMRVFKDGTEISGSPFAIASGAEYVSVGFSAVGSYSAYLCNMSNGTNTKVTQKCHWSVV